LVTSSIYIYSMNVSFNRTCYFIWNASSRQEELPCFLLLPNSDKLEILSLKNVTLFAMNKSAKKTNLKSHYIPTFKFLHRQVSYSTSFPHRLKQLVDQSHSTSFPHRLKQLVYQSLRYDESAHLVQKVHVHN